MKPQTSTVLALENVSYTYKIRKGLSKVLEYKALKGVDLEIKRGETVGVLGRNGSGKSTLLRILAKIISPTGGKIYSEPNLVCTILSLGIGFQKDLSGRDNAILSLMLQGLTKNNAVREIDKIEQISELGEFFDLPIKTYSTGMRARLGFATAMSAPSDVLLMDEVLSVGDKKFKEKALKLVRASMSEKSVVLVSHSLGQVEKVCDRAICLKNGRIVGSGPVSKAIEAYQAL